NQNANENKNEDEGEKNDSENEVIDGGVDNNNDLEIGERILIVMKMMCEYPGCTKSFYQQGGLLNHTKLHIVIRDFKCEYPGCAKASYFKANL
ncbi:18053_t:CDS:2, partial [Entrophospora sp. SA101]